MNPDPHPHPDLDPPPLPPGYGGVIETPPLPPGYGEPLTEPAAASNRRRRKRRFSVPVIFVFIAAALLGLYYGPATRVVRFVDDRGMVPMAFVATLRSGETEKLLVVERGRTRVLRLRWDEIEITDLNYERQPYELTGEGLVLSIERTTSRKLKDAARGLPSVPQRGDPDPARDR